MRQVFRGRSALLATAAIVGSIMVSAPPAMAASVTFKGSAVCNSGRSVVGIWVSSSDGGSGWATRSAFPGDPNAAFFTKTISVSGSSSVYVDVGCGGSSSQWASSNRSATKSVSTTYVYNMWCADPSSGNGKCPGAPLAGTKSTNTFAQGYCTWGAAALWKKATGTYPSWTGDAKYWNERASAAGFKVVSNPRERAIVVFESPAPYGHVAWVTKAYVSGGTIKFDVLEMNYEGLGVWSRRTGLSKGSGISFIVAPSGNAVTSP